MMMNKRVLAGGTLKKGQSSAGAFKCSKRQVFGQILEANRAAAAGAAWAKARLASQLRHLVLKARDYKGASVLSKLKMMNVSRAFKLAPGLLQVTIDRDYQIGMISVSWEGKERLHLPPQFELLSGGQKTDHREGYLK